jgi:hypothetical protein
MNSTGGWREQPVVTTATNDETVAYSWVQAISEA